MEFETDQAAQSRLTIAVGNVLTAHRRTAESGEAGAFTSGKFRSYGQMEDVDLVAMTTQIVSAYVVANKVEANRLEDLIQTVFGALSPKSASAAEMAPDKLTPAQIRKSITPEVLISFEDGKGYKTLKRHLTLRGLTPMEYRSKWGLPFDYPMTSSTYAARRSELAKSVGLGAKGRTAKPKAAPKKA